MLAKSFLFPPPKKKKKKRIRKRKQARGEWLKIHARQMKVFTKRALIHVR